MGVSQIMAFDIKDGSVVCSSKVRGFLSPVSTFIPGSTCALAPKMRKADINKVKNKASIFFMIILLGISAI